VRWTLAIAILCALAHRGRADDRITVVEARVVDPSGRPITDAWVGGTLEWSDQQSTFSIDSADPDGTYALRLTPSSSRLNSIRIFAAKRGYSNADEVRTAPKGRAGYKVVVIRLRPTTTVVVHALDGDRKPVPGATVTLSDDSFSTQHPLKGKPQSIASDGSVTFTGVNDRDSWTLVVAAPGYATLTYTTVDLTKPVELITYRAAAFTARLVDDATGKPVARCKVYVGYGNPPVPATDADGRVTVIDVPIGSVRIAPACADYGTDWDLGPSGNFVTFAEHEVGQVHDVRVRKNQVVRGRVVDARGKPVAGATVTRVFVPAKPDIGFMKEPAFETATTAADGSFTFGSSSMDHFEIYATAPRESKHQTVRYADLRGPIVLTLLER